MHIFSHLPRDLNFLEHTSDVGWKEWGCNSCHRACLLYHYLCFWFHYLPIQDVNLWSIFLLSLSCRYQRARPIIIDPGLYHSKKSGVFWAKEKRVMPASFKLFMGNVFSFVLHCQIPFFSFFLFSFCGSFQCFYALFLYTFTGAFQLNLWTPEPSIVIDNWIGNCWNLLPIMRSWTSKVISGLHCFSFGVVDWHYENRFNCYPQWRKT